MYAIKVENLEKSYGTNNVLKGISFSVSHGEIFALLGTNGAGKTTTLECIEGLLKYENGSIQITGTYGVQSQSSSIPKSMKANEALSLFAKWQHTEINPEYLETKIVMPEFAFATIFELVFEIVFVSEIATSPVKNHP